MERNSHTSISWRRVNLTCLNELSGSRVLAARPMLLDFLVILEDISGLRIWLIRGLQSMSTCILLRSCLSRLVVARLSLSRNPIGHGKAK